jgi:asparagine synthase (glutamine-hydrolysing)
MPLLPKSLYDRVGRLRGHDIKDPFDGWSPINRDWAREMRVAERAAHFGFDALYQPKRSTHDWRAALAGQPANEGGDIFQAMAAIHGIPMRDPTAWRPFFEFCAGVPDDQYIRGGVTRWLARRMLQGRVPDMTLAMQGRGMQAADWHLRLKRQLSEMRGEIDRLASDPDMARRIDIAKLRAAVDEFPDVTPTDWPSTYRAQLALSRGLTTARFIRFVEGRND